MQTTLYAPRSPLGLPTRTSARRRSASTFVLPSSRRPNILLVTDPGPDPDDVKALLVLATLHRDGAITFVGAVCNGGGQPEKRARLARCLLDKLGVPDVPVAIGSHGQPYDAQPHEYALSGFDAVDASRLRPASELVLSILQTSEPGALTVVLISSLRDFADAILAYPQLVRRAVGSVSVMGGLERDERARFGWAADSSVNNGFDMAGAQAVYDWCFAEGVPLAVVSRFAVPLLPMSLARSFAERSNSDVLRYLAEAQFLGLEGLWHKLCAGKLPARCTKQWFCETFCGIDAAQYEAQGLETRLGPSSEIRRRLNGNVKPYDVIALMAALPHTRALVAPSEHEAAASDGAPPERPPIASSRVVSVTAADGRIVRHLLLLEPDHAPELEHVVGLLRETYHKVAFLTRARVNHGESASAIDPRLLSWRVEHAPGGMALSATTLASPARGAAHKAVGPAPTSGAPDASAAGARFVDVGAATTATALGRDGYGLLSQSRLAARLDATLDVARAMDARASGRVVALLVGLIVLAVANGVWSYSSDTASGQIAFAFTFPLVTLAMLVVVAWLRDDRAHACAARLALVAVVLVLTFQLVVALGYALESVDALVWMQARTAVDVTTAVTERFSSPAGESGRALGTARTTVAWAMVAFLALAIAQLAPFAHVRAARADGNAGLAARLWSSVRAFTGAPSAYVLFRESTCLATRCDDRRQPGVGAGLMAVACAYVLTAAAMCLPRARPRLRALLMRLVRWKVVAVHLPLIALLGLDEARAAGGARPREAADVMAAAARAFSVTSIVDLADAVRSGDEEAASGEGALSRVSIWERGAGRDAADRGVDEPLGVGARLCALIRPGGGAATRGSQGVAPEMMRLSTTTGGSSAQLLRTQLHTGALSETAQALVQSLRQVRRSLDTIMSSTSASSDITPPPNAAMAASKMSALAPRTARGVERAPIPAQRHAASCLGQVRPTEALSCPRQQRSRSWTPSPTIGIHPYRSSERAKWNGRVEVRHRERDPTMAMAPSRIAAAESSVDYFVVHSHLDSAELKREALADWCARDEQSGATVWLDVLSARADAEPIERLEHLPFHLARARKLLVLIGVEFARSFEAVMQLYVWAATGGSLDKVEVVLLGGPESAAAVYASLDAFHVMWAQPARCKACQERLVRAVEIASVGGFNEVVRAYLPCVGKLLSTAGVVESGESGRGAQV